MKQEPLIRCTDRSLLTKEYFFATQRALENNPTADHIHFVIVTQNINLKLDVPLKERFLMYEVTVVVSLKEIREQHTDIDLCTARVLLNLFEKYKSDLILH